MNISLHNSGNNFPIQHIHNKTYTIPICSEINHLGSFNRILSNLSYLALMNDTQLWASVPSISSSRSSSGSFSSSLSLPSPPASLPGASEWFALSHQPRPPSIESFVQFQTLLTIRLPQLTLKLLKISSQQNLDLSC